MSTPQKSNSSSGKKKISAKAEARKLTNKEDDWNLAGFDNLPSRRERRRRSDEESTGTGIVLCRPAGQTTRLVPSPKELFSQGEDDSTAVSSLTADSSSSKFYKPPHTRVITMTKVILLPMQMGG